MPRIDAGITKVPKRPQFETQGYADCRGGLNLFTSTGPRPHWITFESLTHGETFHEEGQAQTTVKFQQFITWLYWPLNISPISNRLLSSLQDSLSWEVTLYLLTDMRVLRTLLEGHLEGPHVFRFLIHAFPSKRLLSSLQDSLSWEVTLYLLTYMRVLRTLFVTQFLDGDTLPT